MPLIASCAGGSAGGFGGLRTFAAPGFTPVIAYDSIATFTISTPAISVTFTSIPATYTHLQIRTVSLTTGAGNRYVQVGSSNTLDTGSNYYAHELYGNGATAVSGSLGGTTKGQIFYAQGDANVPAVSVTDILDYTNTNKLKLMRTVGGISLAGSGRITFMSTLWDSTAAINTIKVLLPSGQFEAHTKIALYGIKGA